MRLGAWGLGFVVFVKIPAHSRLPGSGVWGFRFGEGFLVSGLGFRVWRLGIRDPGFRFGFRAKGSAEKDGVCAMVQLYRGCAGIFHPSSFARRFFFLSLLVLTRPRSPSLSLSLPLSRSLFLLLSLSLSLSLVSGAPLLSGKGRS